MSRFAGQSKFFGGGDNTSSSESDSDHQEEEKEQTPSQANKRSKFMMGSDDEEEDERTIKSGATKRAEALDKAIEDTRKYLKNADFNSLDTLFSRLEGEVAKAAENDIFEDKGQKLSQSVLKLFRDMEDTINEVTADQKKKMSKANSVSYNRIKQKFKKYLQGQGEGDYNYEKQLQKFREAPVVEEKEESEESEKAAEEEAEEEEDEEEEDSESDEEIKADRAKAKALAKAESKKEQKKEEAEEYYDEEYDQEDAVDDEDVKLEDPDEVDAKLKKKYAFLWKEREEMTAEERRWKWVKKENLPEDLTELIEKLSTKKQKKVTVAKKDKEESVEEEVEGAEYITTVKTRDDLLVDYTVVANVKTYLEILKQERFKGKFSAMFHVQVLSRMADQMPDNLDLSDTRVKVNVMLLLVGTLLQTAKTGTVLSREDWLITVTRVQQLLSLVNKPQFVKSVQEAHKVQIEVEGKYSFEIERQVLPSLSNFAEGLHDQLWRAYQQTAHTCIEYLQRISDENKLLYLCDSLLQLFTTLDQQEFQARVAIVKLNYVYYKNDTIYAAIKQRLGAKNTGVYYLSDSAQTIQDLVEIVQKWGQPRQRVRATLQQVYHFACHNQINKARELLMKTHMASVIIVQPIDNQILYNRALVQIGLSAFRLGKMRESHDILADICQHQKHKELLAQRISSLQDKSQEFEVEEKKRQMPFHYQINIQLLEVTHYTTSMLLEIPQFAENQFSLSKPTVSKNFKRLIEQYDGKAFQLAAENFKDYIVHAARCLNQSHWQEAVDSILKIPLFHQTPEFQNQEFRTNLADAFKKAALEAFLHRAANQYKSFCLQSLQDMFGMNQAQLRKIVGQLIMGNRLQMQLDFQNNLLRVDEGSGDIKELQQLSLQYVSQIQVMVTQNEHVANFAQASKKVIKAK